MLHATIAVKNNRNRLWAFSPSGGFDLASSLCQNLDLSLAGSK
jgi:hypothetical protein